MTSGVDVQKALLGWPKCPDCGQWMEIEVARNGSDASVWTCQHSGYKIRSPWWDAAGVWVGDRWTKWREGDTFSMPLAEIRKLPKLTPDQAQLLMVKGVDER